MLYREINASCPKNHKKSNSLCKIGSIIFIKRGFTCGHHQALKGEVSKTAFLECSKYTTLLDKRQIEHTHTKNLHIFEFSKGWIV